MAHPVYTEIETARHMWNVPQCTYFKVEFKKKNPGQCLLVPCILGL